MSKRTDFLMWAGITLVLIALLFTMCLGIQKYYGDQAPQILFNSLVAVISIALITFFISLNSKYKK